MTFPNFKQSLNRVGSTILKGFLIKAQLLSNPKSRFIRVVEDLQDGRTAFICIPEWLRSSGWSLFEHNMLCYFGHLITSALFRRNHGTSHSTAWLPQHPPILIADKRPYQPPPVPLHQPPRVNPNPKHGTTTMTLSSYSPIPTPSRSATSKSICSIGIWPLSAICHMKWKDLHIMAKEIAKAARLPFTPILKPFGEGRALFSVLPWCKRQRWLILNQYQHKV